MNVEKRNQIISVVLALVIIALGYFLFQSIVGPYQEVQEREEMTQRVRHQMQNVADALQDYKETQGEFPPTDGGLDSLVNFLKEDSTMQADGDSLFAPYDDHVEFDADSLVYSPRPPHDKFEYTLNDTLNPKIYMLEDPDSDDAIGDLERTTLMNAPSWN